jgi:S-adenosylmethionine decarboxylase
VDLVADLVRSEPAEGVGLGREFFIDATGCTPAALKSVETLKGVFDLAVAELGLRPLNQIWHTFPEPGGVTGLMLLSESHLTVHTFPEYGGATFNLYCCRPKPVWPWAERLRDLIGATDVRVRTERRG